MRRILFLFVPCVAFAGSVGTLTLEINEPLAGSVGAHLTNGTYSIQSNKLTFSRADFETYAGGSLYGKGFELASIPHTLDFDLSGGYRLGQPHLGYVDGRLFLDHMDISYAGWIIGTARVEVDQPPPAHALGLTPCTTNFGPSVDVALTALYNLFPKARDGVRVSVGPATQLKNVGTYSVPWFWAINPPQLSYATVIGQHPYVIFNFYRVLNGVLEQIGRSDAKHAFYSTNEDCPCAGAQTIFPGCSDTYQYNNNVNQFFFAPRNEITAHTGAWTLNGSHFDGTPVDGIRHHSNEVNNFTHLLVLQEADLLLTNAQYYIEAWYIVQNDTNIFNTMGHCRVTPTLAGTNWSFPIITSLATGPVINSWASYTNVLVDTGEGHLKLAVSTSNPSNGWVRYRYALMNHDYDRQIKNFSVPLLSNITATNFTFYDGDTNAANNWTATLTNQAVRWQTPSTNGLDWGVLFSFAFDANAPPENGSAALGILENATNESLSVATRVPHAPLALEQNSTQIVWSAASGAIYQVQASSDITSGWFDVDSPITAQSPNLSIVDTNDSATQMFYRVLQLP